MAKMANHNVDWDDARLIAYESILETATEAVALAQAIGRTCAVDLIAQTDLPPAHTAMMDGYAVSGAGPWKIVDEVRAGQYISEIEPCTAIRVSTGAQIPAASSFVIPDEDAIAFDGEIASKVPVPLGKHIRIPGDEAKCGEVVLPTGSVITPVAAGLAASASIDEILVRKLPTIDVLVTGDELIGSGIPKPGQIRDSLSIQIPSWISKFGCQVGQIMQIKDDENETRNKIADCAGELVITTGGTSHGDFDYVRSALLELGADLLIDEINMRPGHPTILAKLPSGQLVAGLPGNPLAALVSFLTVVVPAINRLLGQSLMPTQIGTLKKGFYSDLTRIIPISFEGAKVVPTEFRGSAMLRGLAQAHNLAVIGAGENPPGTQVRLLTLPW